MNQDFRLYAIFNYFLSKGRNSSAKEFIVGVLGIFFNVLRILLIFASWRL
jgi:hypothetical protein